MSTHMQLTIPGFPRNLKISFLHASIRSCIHAYHSGMQKSLFQKRAQRTRAEKRVFDVFGLILNFELSYRLIRCDTTNKFSLQNIVLI